MRKNKQTRMLEAYAGFAGHATVAAILEKIPDDLKRNLTGKQLGLVMRAVADSYRAGIQSQKPIEKVDDCIWVDGINKLIPIAALAQIVEHKDERGNHYEMSYCEAR